MQNGVYLRPAVMVEPLFNQWYSWPYLLSPATGAMYVANVHLKLMQSFVDAPQMHCMALKNPMMRGGPFLDHDPSRVPEVRELLERTAKQQAPKVKFAEAVKALDRILTEEANGQSLEAFYSRVPDALRGYVELVYDLNHHANIRFMEGLLYRSPYHDLASQSVVLSPITEERRPFVFSTPRLPRAGDVRLDVPFTASALDDLYRARYTPTPLAGLAETLGVRPEDGERFAALFTDQPPRERAPCAGDGVRIRYFGHACVLIDTREVSVLVDPMLSHDDARGVPRFSLADLPPVIDCILLTHAHQDHAVIEPLLELRHRARQIVVPRSSGGILTDPSLRLILRQMGFAQVKELGDMEELPIEGGSITGLPFLGEHGDLNIQTKLAYNIKLKGRSITLMADSNNLEPRLYEHTHAAIGDADVLLIGMECEGAPMSWMYGALFTKPLARKMDQSRRLDGSNFEKAADIVRRFNPKQVYVYAMGQEPWLSHLMSIQYTDKSLQIVESNKLLEYCKGRGIHAERPYCQKEILLDPA